MARRRLGEARGPRRKASMPRESRYLWGLGPNLPTETAGGHKPALDAQEKEVFPVQAQKER